ncbi:MAG: DUF6288 domain-containing protein [Akkermansiaceae bacterium]|nr:DUF6288 domain-containing protein [Akkermansiaceae bacterium]
MKVRVQEGRRNPRQAGSSWWMFLLLLVVAALPAMAQRSPDYYTEPQVFGMRPNPAGEKELGPIGVTGIEARIYPGVKVRVEDTQPGTPAHGRFSKGDVILGVNGTMLQGRHPLVVLGSALTDAEATDGVLVFDIKRGAEAETRKVTVKIPVLGAYSGTFPLNCGKSQQIIRKAAEFYAGKDRLDKHDFLNALACLFLLSTGDDQYVPRVKAYFAQFLNPDGSAKPLGDHTWHNGYNGVACAEYYLRTGDRSVLPILQHYCDDARDRQMYGIGWNHWGYGSNPAYEAGGGLMHCAGTQVLLTLVLGKECGVKVDDKTLLGALRHWYRFAGHGTLPLADQRYWMAHLRSAGRDGGAAAVMHIASHAKGDVTIYQKARDYLAMSALTSWPERNYNWEVYWQSLAGPFVREFNPGLYFETMRMFRWTYDLGRQASGAFFFPRDHDSLDPTDQGISLALAYTAPLKTLQITGAPRSKHAKEFTLPEHLWGNPADLAFLDPTPNEGYHRYGQNESIHIPWHRLPHGLQGQYGPAAARGIELPTMLKNVRHARCEVRAAAAKALVFNKKFDEIERLLRDPDPRLRRAALDGISDCNPWFTSPPTGRNALGAEAFTPGMIDAISSILRDPAEAWFVIDGAMLALSGAPVEAIKRNIPFILPWTTHEDWWLRESAFHALMGLQRDPVLLEKHLPALIGVMLREYRYNPRHQMVGRLEEALARVGKDSAAGKMIIDGFSRGPTESEVQPDVGRYPRSREGTTNIIEIAQVVIQQAPEVSADLAEALVESGRLAGMETESLMKIIKGQDGHVSDRFVGLFPALEGLAAQQKSRLTDLLYDGFRPELLRRLEAEGAGADGQLLDMLVELTALKKPIKGWRPVGSPPPPDRAWRYLSFDPLTEKDRLHPRIGPPKRLREVTMPQGTDGWFQPGFDDSAWQSGRSPIGVGEFKAHGHGRGWTYRPDFFYENHSAWGDGEFLLMRTTFEADDLDFDYLRIRILSDQGYHIYLNGQKIRSYGWFQHFPRYENVLLTGALKKHLKKGSNTLAVFANVRFEQDPTTQDYHHVGQIDLSIEGLKKVDLGPGKSP